MRPHDIVLIQRAMLQDVPLSLILSELWRRALAWVDGWTR